TSFADLDAGVIWLLEPRRSTAVNKWSGTMVHPNRLDKLHMTMSAFAHFSFLWSESTLVFADLQSSYGRRADKTPAKILFDIMTHTRAGSSGVGDHGLEGLKKFISDHECNDTCEALDLEPL
ncbi:kinase-like domain-containing protein, partial [Trametes polyzona]